ncbi:hypothetical protein LTR56_017533 [Elasticomyces elasticus]|nr:hypothetical protein LTR22_022393 [Elasticomyces elasticus]KAK3630245.1 hypothetical protein LTR56_017533 [Elasticomyces elasticus]KAK4913917.1 hypothetical protein LTR49_017843 [Elasticomyces elasticus]KAK5766378.1 hypothetical protein LTS12_003590 [Elasticomyces elasticus]
MHSISVTNALLVAFAASAAQAQTPPGSQPSTSRSLGIAYGSNGNTTVTPNILLPQPLTLVQPIVSLEQQLNGTHMLAMVDLSINQNSAMSSLNGTGPQAQGLEPCRTTRLHWLQTGLTQTADGTFVNTTSALGEYGGPRPPANDIPHTYAFYLFRQPANFTLPAWDAGRDYVASSAPTRMNFSVTAISDVVGAPIAANYIRVQNPNSTAPGTANNGTCPAGATNGTTSPTPVPYTGAATNTQARSGAAVIIGGVAMFAML